MIKQHLSISKIGFFLLLSLTFFACERVLDTFDRVTYEYFPLEAGKYKTYRVDSTVWDEYNCTTIKTTYYLKEVTGPEGLDGEGDPYHTVNRYIRSDSSQAWNLHSIWTEKIEDNQLQRVEDNQRMIKLVFPIKESRAWDGIVFIRRDTLVPLRGGSIDMFKDWDEFVYDRVDETFVDTISNKIYPEAVQVMQVDKTNNIERRFSREVFAKNIGMVYKELWILDTQCRQGSCSGVGDISTCILTPWDEKAEKGFIVTMSLIDHNY